MKINSNPQLTEDDYNNFWDEELRQWLEEYIIKYPHHDTAVLSRSQYIGIPRGVLDLYLEKKFFLPKGFGGEGNNSKTSKVEPAIRAYRSKIGAFARHGYGKRFFETSTWKQMRHALKIALDENVIIVAYGKPGVGKSKALSEFSLRETTNAPITMLCSRNVTATYFVKYIADKLKVRGHGQIAEIEDSICDKLIKYPRPLFVDQANFLSERSLGSVCHIWEKAKIPIALIGTTALYNSFMKSTLTEDVRAQLTSRIAIHYLLPELELSEVKAIVEYSFGEEATNEMIAQIYNITGGIHRNVDMIIARILHLKAKNFESLESKEIDMENLIAVAGSRLMIS
ncbi:MAG: AAA family ATPase [Pyrinomonadaceae bacterium]